MDLVGSHGRWKRPCLQTTHLRVDLVKPYEFEYHTVLSFAVAGWATEHGDRAWPLDGRRQNSSDTIVIRTEIGLFFPCVGGCTEASAAKRPRELMGLPLTE